MNTDELLKFAIESGMIDLQHIQASMSMIERKKYLFMHPYSIWQNKQGKFCTHLPDEKQGRVVKRRSTKEEIEDVIVQYWKDQEFNPTLKEIFDEWNERRLELDQISHATFCRQKQVFERHYTKYQTLRIGVITPEWIEDFLERQIAEHNLTAKGYANLKGITRGMFKRAKKRKLIDLNIEMVFSEMEISKKSFKKVVKEDYEEVFSESETELMMNYLKKNIDTCNIGILLIFLTGLRVGELVALKHEDIDGLSIKVRRTETRIDIDGLTHYEVKDFPKTEAGVRTVIVPPDYEWVMKRLKIENPFGDFVFMNGQKRMNTSAIRQRLYKLCDELGIYRKSPHKIRKTYGSILIDNRIDSKMIIDQMGHTNILCTEQFYHRNRKTNERKTEILGTIPEFKAK